MPFKSQAQRRLFYAKAARGEISRAKVREWERETPKDKKLPEKVAAILRPRNIAIAGALAVPYAVGKKVQKEQAMQKSAAFEAGVVEGMSKEALSPALRNKAMGMRLARTFRDAGGKGGYLSSSFHPSNYAGPLTTTMKSMAEPSPAMRRYLNSGAKDLVSARKAGGGLGMAGAAAKAVLHQNKGMMKEFAKKK